MGILKRKGPDPLPPNRKIERMSDDLLYTFAETQLMDAGYHLSQWRETGHIDSLDMAHIASRWSMEALGELYRRS